MNTILVKSPAPLILFCLPQCNGGALLFGVNTERVYMFCYWYSCFKCEFLKTEYLSNQAPPKNT